MRMKILINFDVIENFFNQIKIKKHELHNVVDASLRFNILNDTSFRTYQIHNIFVTVTDFSETIVIKIQNFIETDMKDIDIILNLF